MSDEGTVSDWSARRRRVNHMIAQQQASSYRIGQTETHDDALTEREWALLFAARTGDMARRAMIGGEIANLVTDLAVLAHAYLESFDRKHGDGDKAR